MKQRQYLNNSILLCGKSNGTVFKRTFSVIKKLADGEGASSLCYEAYHESSGRGVLKEFYPHDAYYLERNNDGQLIFAPMYRDSFEHERFIEAEKEYIEPYEMLAEAKRRDENQELATFIPSFEIYYGCDEYGNIAGTAYIWTPEPKLETFDKVCRDIHNNPTSSPEHKMITVLSAIESLTKCVCALHCADMIHRDIKPSNFGFIKRGSETLTQTLSMFDINSICSVFAKTNEKVGTPGYLEPEAGYEPANNQTDIYSIGATLFHALIVTEEVKENGYLYKREYYNRLREMVDESALIQASEANSHPRLKNILTEILRKCLCEREYRYDNCEELIDDLEEALYYALPSELVHRKSPGARWVLADAEKFLDKNAERNTTAAIQYHLYKNPLYMCCPEQPSLEITIIGMGKYGSIFLDNCLQTGQMPKKSLNVHIFSSVKKDNGISDKELYLCARPQLAEFFDIDGSLAGDPDSCGKISFNNIELSDCSQEKNESIFRDVISETAGKGQYVFIALGNDKLNIQAAKAYKKAADTLGITACVNFVCEQTNIDMKSDCGISPIFVHADYSNSPLAAEIERMAFNVHLTWEKGLNLDYKRAKNLFHSRYYHDSSVACALSIKYKLYSIGIDLDKCTFEQAAEEAVKKGLCSKKGSCIKDELTYTEHSRWTAEKLCSGWTSINNLNECIALGDTKDKKTKRHVCIAKSGPNNALEEFNKNDYRKWEECSSDELAELDELDRVSVMLHRVYVEQAQKVKESNTPIWDTISGMRSIIDGHKECVFTFQEWYGCIKDIYGEDKVNAIHAEKLYQGLKDAFLNSAKHELPKDKAAALEQQIKSFEAMFGCIRESVRYRDYKQDDILIIENIPFILTYCESAYLVIPYSMRSNDGNTEIFANVASVTAVNPKRVIYLCYLEDKDSLLNLKRTLPPVSSYMSKKKLKAVLDFVIIGQPDRLYLNDNIKEEFKCLTEGRVRQIHVIEAAHTYDIVPRLNEYLSRRKIGKRKFAVEFNGTGLSNMLSADKDFCGSFDIFEFDTASLKFKDIFGSSGLNYITKKPYITVNEMLAITNSSGKYGNQPEFFAEYKTLWSRYRANTKAWKSLCGMLGDYANSTDIVIEQKKSKSPMNEYVYIIPYMCKKSVKKILDFLTSNRIAEHGGEIHAYTTDCCEVIIKDSYNNRDVYNKLFSNPYMLLIPEYIELDYNPKSRKAVIGFNDLRVENMQITDVAQYDEIIGIVEFLSGIHYITGLQITEKGLSFTYASRQIKQLLTSEGRILEIYVYHKLRETREFDDVVCGFDVEWGNTGVKNEFDCICTSGFTSLFIECKARPNIESEFYYKLSDLTRQYGINARAVLVADTLEKPHYNNVSANNLQRARGDARGIITIYNKNEISNIGSTLKSIINGRYKPKE